MEILEEVCPHIDFQEEKELVDGSVLTSFDIISIISSMNDTFGITVTPAEIIPENFNSAEAMLAMVNRLKG